MNKKRAGTRILFISAAVCLIAGICLSQREGRFWQSETETENHAQEMVSISEVSVAEISSMEIPEINQAETEQDESISSVEINQNTIDKTASEEKALEIFVDDRIENPYQFYYNQNSDMAGWLKIPDTFVDNPVMWTPEDEEYYLYKGFDKKKDNRGCFILDTDSNMYPTTTNLIIHGHNMPGSMFGELDKYEKKAYRDEHPYIYLYGKDYEHIYEVMAVFRSKVYYTTDVCFKYYKFFQADTEEEFYDFYDNVMKMSVYETGVEAVFGDRFLTLSTCAYHTENGRFVVVAKEIEPGDFYLPLDDK